MKRDMDIVRLILMQIADEDGPTFDGIFRFGETPAAVVTEHVKLLMEAGYIDGGFIESMDEAFYHGLRLTWSGNDFVETIRDDGVWGEAKKRASKVGSWSVSLISELAKAYAKQKAVELGFLPH